jgi:hypothetical protein
MRVFPVAALAALLAASASVSAPSASGSAPQNGSSDLPEKFTAFAVSLGGPRTTSGTAQIDITIDRWSTDAERERLLEALKAGQDELLETLRELPPIGSIRTATSLAYDLHYANETPGEDGGRRIVLATDRPIGWWEAVNRPRTIDYPFTFIELRLNGEGEGEGKLSLATKVIARGRIVQLENYAAQPVQLNQVRRVE